MTALTGPTVRVKEHKQPSRPTEADVAYVFARDRGCVLHLLVLGHVCRDEWGIQHLWNDLGKLSVEHVLEEPRMGKRAPSDPRHMVAACRHSNAFTVETSKYRPQIRNYLNRIENARVEETRERARHDWEQDARANAVINEDREPVEPLDEASR
jgi:hypothetical protein